MRPTRNQLIESERQETARIKRYLEGDDISQTAPLWIAPGVPTHWNAVLLSAYYDIQREQMTTKRSASENGQIIWFATMTCKRGDLSRIGASVSQDREIAIELAFRNSVRQLIIHGLTKQRAVWQDKAKNIRRYA